LSESQPSEQQSPIILTEIEIINDTEFRISPIQEQTSPPEITISGPSHSKIPDAPPVINLELAKICNNILNRMKSLHQLRYSFTEPYMYMGAWETLMDDINADLNKIQNGDINELVEFQKNTKYWVKGVNEEFESTQLKKKGRLSIPATSFDDTIVT
ncbi:hypothetical protein A2U01_0032654, partial [Trifolium medium]|nr:hypothetical protein [Trifolium medium]